MTEGGWGEPEVKTEKNRLIRTERVAFESGWAAMTGSGTMGCNPRNILPMMGFLVLLVVGCSGQFSSQLDRADVSTSEPSSAAESANRPPPASSTNVYDLERPVSERSAEGRQDGPVEEEPTSQPPPEDIPDEKERDAVLDRVNLGPGPPKSLRGGSGSGPMPGTESTTSKTQRRKK